MNTFKAKISDHLPLERSVRARTQDGSLSNPEPLSHYRDMPAWVLLADPGAGKTDTFKTLCAAEGGYDTTARNFVTQPLPSGQVGPIFIDGLDEMTAGGTFDHIRAKLQQLGMPKFRISCREADWRGNVDSNELQHLVGSDHFAELHLAPLTREQTQDLIAHWQQSSDDEAERFMREAKHRDLSGLLDNPQTLRMLVKALASKGGDWPASKTQTYEMACAQLVQEQNEAHRAAQENSVLPFAHVLEAAGYLSAVMLLSGRATIVRQPPRDAHANTLALSDLSYGITAPDKTACRAALLHTSLFRGTGSQREFVPVHRTVAEYLGARYLRSRIDAGLPASRVLALMTGEDGGIVPELRGLHAWLAATALGELRRELIARDPLGVVLNGDVLQFNRDEKLQVLKALRDEATRYTYFRSQNWASHPFGALATADMANDFKALLQSADRSPAHQALVDCVLDAMAHGQHMLELAPVLELVVRDKTYWSDSRTEALGILVTYARSIKDWSALTQLLADVHGNVVEDLEDELLGALLQALYPSHISPTEVWRHFRKPKSERQGENYWLFWHDLPKRSTAQDDVPALLDALVSAGDPFTNTHDHWGSAEIVGELLVHCVTQYGGGTEVPRLYRWLSLGLGPHHNSLLEPEHKAAIGQWFSAHPELYKALFEHGLHMLLDSSDSGLGKLWQLRVQLGEAQEPDDAEQWYLSLAHASPDEDLRRVLVSNAHCVAAKTRGPDAAIELLENWSASHSSDSTWADGFLWHPYPRPESEQRLMDSRLKNQELEAEHSRERTEFFRKTLPSFDSGPAHLGALVAVANAYLNSQKKAARRDLLELLNQNKDWVRLALHGLRQCLFRDDLPSAANIVDLHTRGQRYHLAAPCLAAMALRYTENPATAFDLPPSLLETVATFRLINYFHETGGWFKQLLAQHPAVLSNAMQRLIQQQIAIKIDHIESLHGLIHDPDYATVAVRITPMLIADFPVKASENQLKNLRLLIVSMMTHLDSGTQRMLIASKQRVKGMDVGQQAYWLTAGVLLAPELYLERAQQFVAKTQARASHVFALIQGCRGGGGLRADLPVTTQAFLISLLSPQSSPPELLAAGAIRWVAPGMEMGEYVANLITTLAGNPDDAAMQVLTDLQQRQEMKHWNDTLSRALYDQRITRRKARFKPASVTQVCDTLANLNPANAADLWALTVDHLKQLILEIRNGSSNDYRQYWAGETPKLEDDCRDAFLSDLKKLLLPLEISAEREGHYADAKRADIKIITGSLHLPIEIKREMNEEVWTAVGNQLVAKYSRETASDGYGIYLVFWFTGNLKAAPSDGGSKPKTPQDLQRRLSATVPEALKHKIAVLVVDCSKP